MAKKELIGNFKYADLDKCEYFLFHSQYRTTIYFVDNERTPMYCEETRLSCLLRKLKLKKTITFGKPKKLPVIEPPLENVNFDNNEPVRFKTRIRYAGEKIKDELQDNFNKFNQ